MEEENIKNKTSIPKIVTIVISGFLLLAVFYFIGYRQGLVVPDLQSDTATTENTPDEKTVTSGSSQATPSTNSSYRKPPVISGERVIDAYSSEAVFDEESYRMETISYLSGGVNVIDQRLVALGEQAYREVLIPSLRYALPELKTPYILSVFVALPSQEKIVFVANTFDENSSLGNLYVYNLASNSFSKMEASNYLPRSKDNILKTSDNTRFLSLIDYSVFSNNSSNKETKEIFLVNLLNDSVSTIAEVNTGETLTKTLDSWGEPVGNMYWIDSNTIGYSVYRSSDYLSTNSSRPELEKRRSSF